jgi:HEAT repeat protein
MISEQKLVTDLQSEDAGVRFSAWRQAGDAPVSAIPQLGKLAASERPGVAKAAREALAAMVHSAGKETGTGKRAAVVKGLVGLTAPVSPLPVRVHAFRLLSHIAEEDSVAAIAKEIHNPELAEEVVSCLERIPGKASIDALLAAYEKAPDSFKPRILAALGHRRAPEAVPLCLEAIGSQNQEIALAGVKAFGRIGREPAETPRFPAGDHFSPWEKIELLDSMLRYADAQAAEGSATEALALYRIVLKREEEHWQCAAVIGIAKIGTAEAAAAILPLLDSPNPRVRITARNAWRQMAAGGRGSPRAGF